MAKRNHQVPRSRETQKPTAAAAAVKPRTLLLIVIGAIALVVAGIAIVQAQALRSGAPDVSRMGEGTAWGPEDAAVTIVDYSDFGCVHCSSFALNQGKQLRETYEAGGQVRFEFRHFIVGGDATAAAANAAECAADQGRFWDYHDMLFRQQGVVANPFSKPSLKQYAAQLGLDTQQFNRCVDNDLHLEDVYTLAREGQGQGVKATPTFFINGEMLEGAYPYEEFQRRIDAQLAES